MILDGKKIATSLYDEMKSEVEKFQKKPKLGVILVGNNPASLKYIEQKRKWAKYIGIDFELCQLSVDIPEASLLNQMDLWNKDKNISGYIVQLPLPKRISQEVVLSSISPQKDVDGFHPINQGKLLLGDNSGFVACTPSGVMKLLEYQKIELSGKNVTVIGRSNIVGKPLSALLINAGATLTCCNSSTRDLSEHTKNADILIVAAGVPHLIGKNHISNDAIVIDVGFHYIDGKISGDCDFEKIEKNGNLITPVPGGVGPMTVAMLMKNTIKAYLLNA